MHSDSCSTLKEQRNIEDLHWYLSELKQVLSYWEPLCSITLNKKGQNLKIVRALKVARLDFLGLIPPKFEH